MGTIEVHQGVGELDSLRFHYLHEVSTVLSTTRNLEEVLKAVITAATLLTGSESASIIVADGLSGTVHEIVSMEPLINEKSVILEGSAAGWILKTGRYLLVDKEKSRTSNDLVTFDDRQYRDLLGVPLLYNGKAIGVLQVTNKRNGGAYTDIDRVLLETLAAQSAIAIENARLFQQTDLINEFMHELKTPLMAITAASELLARGIESSQSVEIVEMIQNETERLAKMAQDFLDLARLESGHVEIGQEPVDINRLVRDVARIQKPQAIKRNITLDIDLPPQTITISGDYDRLKQVLLNLTSNAIKYNGAQGQVKVLVRVHPGEVILEVSDNGPGIAEENLPHLFERFYRIPDSEGFTKGTGLGLSISARIMQEHGGRIEVESELGKGSIFLCRLPR